MSRRSRKRATGITRYDRGGCVAGRLRAFFVREQGRYRVRKKIREKVLFAPHNVLKDSPFSRCDLISCRNLLIYLTIEAHAQIFDIFHFALRRRPAFRRQLGK